MNKSKIFGWKIKHPLDWNWLHCIFYKSIDVNKGYILSWSLSCLRLMTSYNIFFQGLENFKIKFPFRLGIIQFNPNEQNVNFMFLKASILVISTNFWNHTFSSSVCYGTRTLITNITLTYPILKPQMNMFHLTI